ncbi:Pectinesterase [Psidium guajava]|nr:Pectinesterase [Psidium guajava]
MCNSITKPAVPKPSATSLLHRNHTKTMCLSLGSCDCFEGSRAQLIYS